MRPPATDREPLGRYLGRPRGADRHLWLDVASWGRRHVVPDFGGGHVLTRACPCGTTVQEIDGVAVVVHQPTPMPFPLPSLPS